MGKVMSEGEARQAGIEELLEQADEEGPILVEREAGKPPVLVLPLGQPGRAAVVAQLKNLQSALRGPADLAATGDQMDGLIEALGQPGRA